MRIELTICILCHGCGKQHVDTTLGQLQSAMIPNMIIQQGWLAVMVDSEGGVKPFGSELPTHVLRIALVCKECADQLIPIEHQAYIRGLIAKYNQQFQ